MVMAQNPQPEISEDPDEPLTEIVSYLDGELSDTQMNEVEQSLIKDPDMRSHADILSRTWALLDELEEVSASRKFTAETLATIAAETIPDDAPAAGDRLRQLRTSLGRYRVLPCLLAGIIGGVGGLLLSQRVIERRQNADEGNPTRIVLENFELLRNTEHYSIIPDVQSLQQLALPNDPSVPAGRSEEGDEQ